MIEYVLTIPVYFMLASLLGYYDYKHKKAYAVQTLMVIGAIAIFILIAYLIKLVI